MPPALRIAHPAVEFAQQLALVDQQRSLGGKAEGAFVLQGLGVDEDIGVAAHCDRVGNAAEVLRLAGEHADAIARRLEVGKQARVAHFRHEPAGKDRLQQFGGEADVAVGRGHGAAHTDQRLQVGCDGSSAYSLGQRIGPGAFHHHDDDVGAAGEIGRGRARLRNRHEGEVAAVAVLVDAVAGHVERKRMTGRIERVRVAAQPDHAISVAVEIGGERDEAHARVPGERAVEPAGRVLAGRGYEHDRAQEGGGGQRQPAPSRRAGNGFRIGAGQAPRKPRDEPPRADDQQQRRKRQRDLVLAEQQRVGQAAPAQPLDEREIERVAEIAVQLVLRRQRQQRQAEIDEGEMHHRQRISPPPGQVVDQPPGDERGESLGDGVAGGEGGNFRRPIDRARLAEPAAEQPVFPIRHGQFEQAQERGRERHERPRPQPADDQPAERISSGGHRAPISRQG